MQKANTEWDLLVWSGNIDAPAQVASALPSSTPPTKVPPWAPYEPSLRTMVPVMRSYIDWLEAGYDLVRQIFEIDPFGGFGKKNEHKKVSSENTEGVYGRRWRDRE